MIPSSFPDQNGLLALTDRVNPQLRAVIGRRPKERMKKLRVLVADDHEVVRRGVRVLLESRDDVEVIDEAANGREAVDKVERLKPDLVVLDITMPELNGLEATRRIVSSQPRTQVVIFTMHESEQVAREVLAAGARGYVLKSEGGQELLAAIDAARQRKPFFTTRVSEMVLEGYLGGIERGHTATLLTGREREIIQLLAEGKSHKEIAGVLNISVKTVDTHRANIMRKLNLRSVHDLIHYAIRNNIIQA